MWTVIFLRNNAIERQEECESYYHAQILADNLILTTNPRFGTDNFPIYNSGEIYYNDGITIKVINSESIQNTLTIKENPDFISWVKKRSAKSRWNY